MQLRYLEFDFSDEDSGRGSFDAMASVPPERLPELLAEIAAVLRWSHASCGPPAEVHDAGEWDFDLQGTAEPDVPLHVTYDTGRGALSISPPPGTRRTTLTLTLGGSPAFCAAFRDAFIVDA